MYYVDTFQIMLSDKNQDTCSVTHTVDNPAINTTM